jgi:hypothetical protein
VIRAFQDVQERALSAAGRTKDSRRFTDRQLQRDAVKHVQRAAPRRIVLGQVFGNESVGHERNHNAASSIQPTRIRINAGFPSLAHRE